MNSPRLSAFLVEDEPLCRADFRQALNAFPEIKLVGEADSLNSARQFLHQQAVDLLFLDISVGKENGLDLLEQLPTKPMVIALTAHPQHAVRGFRLDLVDYILKPVEVERLRAALGKARVRQSSSLLQPGKTTFVAEMDGKKNIVELAEMIRLESMGNYVVLHIPRGHAVKRTTLKELRSQLPAGLFLETSRGRLVARHHIRGWNRDSKGHLVLQLTNGESQQVSRTHASVILKTLKTQNLP